MQKIDMAIIHSTWPANHLPKTYLRSLFAQGVIHALVQVWLPGQLGVVVLIFSSVCTV